jgi:methylase of polypeptide subunit release factors
VPKDKSKVKSQKSKKNNGIYFEPENAIFANNNGTEIIKKFLNQARSQINNDRLILIEVDPRNAKELFKYSKSLYINYRMKLIKDLSQKNRVIKILT